jgi:DNA-binding MarR family transcriptional regulator
MENTTIPVTQLTLQQIAQDCLCLQMRQTTRLLTQWYDTCLQPSGLRLTQVSLLVAIALAQTAPLTRLADILALERTTLARNLKPLERAGLVDVSPGEDKRVRLIRLTRQGEERLAQALPYWRQAQEEVRARVGSSEWVTLRADLRRLEAQLPSSV